MDVALAAAAAGFHTQIALLHAVQILRFAQLWVPVDLLVSAPALMVKVAILVYLVFLLEQFAQLAVVVDVTVALSVAPAVVRLIPAVGAVAQSLPGRRRVVVVEVLVESLAAVAKGAQLLRQLATSAAVVDSEVAAAAAVGQVPVV